MNCGLGGFFLMVLDATEILELFSVVKAQKYSLYFAMNKLDTHTSKTCEVWEKRLSS